MNIILFIILGLIFGLIIAYFLPKEKARTHNKKLDEEENQLKLKIKDLEKEYITVENNYKEKERKLEENIQALDLSYKDKEKEQQFQLQSQVEQTKRQIEEKKQQAEIELINIKNQKILVDKQIESGKELATQINEDAKTLEDKVYDLMTENMISAQSSLEIEYKNKEKEARSNYNALMQDLIEEYQSLGAKLEKEYAAAHSKLTEEQLKAAAATEANKRAELEKSQKDFYRLQLSQTDIEEIKKLRSVEPYLRDKEPLNKVIYKSYYEKPYTDLIGRVFGTRKPSGIYKITNLQNGMCYVGQSVNLPERWRQHIKRGVGAEQATQNKLYPAMKELGVENFMFEVIEECSGADLTPREKFWTEFYEAQTYGYSVKKG